MQNQSLQQTMRGCSKVVGCMISDLHSSSDLVLKGCCMLAESQQKTARLYRHSQHMLEMGLVSVVIFGLMGVGSVTAAILNVDGSFRNPILAACIFGGFWGCLCLVGLWMILIYYRHELHIDSGNVRHRGGLLIGSVCLSRLTCATWKSFTGCLTLHDGSGSVKVAFGNYTHEEQRELIRFFREALVDCDQHGWEQFEKRCLPPQVEYRVLQKKIRGHLRFAATAFAVATPLMYGILIWQRLNGGLQNRSPGVIATLPLLIAGMILGIMWFAARADLSRARTRDD